MLLRSAVAGYTVGGDVVSVKSFGDGRKLLIDGVGPGCTSLMLIQVDGGRETYDVHIAH